MFVSAIPFELSQSSVQVNCRIQGVSREIKSLYKINGEITAFFLVAKFMVTMIGLT